jgi:hypothetical protein
MNIPTVPNAQLLSNEGSIHPAWHHFFTQLSQQLQHSFTEANYAPHQTTDQITRMQTVTATTPAHSRQRLNGGTVYNKTTSKCMINNDGEYRPVSTLENLTTAEITAIPSGKRTGRYIIDTTTNKLKVGINDAFVEITTTP